MVGENVFPLSVMRYGLLGLLGVFVFLSSLIIVHLTSPGIDWMRDYVSNLAILLMWEVWACFQLIRPK